VENEIRHLEFPRFLWDFSSRSAPLWLFRDFSRQKEGERERERNGERSNKEEKERERGEKKSQGKVKMVGGNNVLNLLSPELMSFNYLVYRA